MLQGPKPATRTDEKALDGADPSDTGRIPRGEASLGPVGMGSIPTCARPQSYSNDHELGSSIPRRYTWEAEQRKGMVCHVTDSDGPIGHTRKEIGIGFRRATPDPLSGEVTISVEFIPDVGPNEAAKFRSPQLTKVREIARASETPNNSGGN